MGAYGDITCKYCGQSYYELDEHDCDMGYVKEAVDELQAREDKLRDLVKEWRDTGEEESWCADQLERLLDE